MKDEPIYTELEARLIAEYIVSEYLDWVIAKMKDKPMQRPIFSEMWDKYKK